MHGSITLYYWSRDMSALCGLTSAFTQPQTCQWVCARVRLRPQSGHLEAYLNKGFDHAYT